MIGAKVVYDPKIKVVPLIKYYNFTLVHTSMKSLYHIVQTRSNLLHLNDGIHLNYDLVTKLALAMNTKVVHDDMLNMFRLFPSSHNHFLYSLMIICIYTKKHKITNMFHMFQSHVSNVKA